MASDFGEWHHTYKKLHGEKWKVMQMFRALRIEPPFGPQAAVEGVASALGWEILGIIGNLCGDIRAFSELGDMRFQARLPTSPAYERAP